MIRRRDDRKPLSDRQAPHWLTVSDMQGRVLDASSLAPGIDLYAVLAREMDRLHRSSRRLIWANPLLRFSGFEAKAAHLQQIGWV